MGIIESYRDHLAGTTDKDRLAGDLRDAGLHFEAGLVGLPADSGASVVMDPSSWMLGRRLWRGPFPPTDPGAGDIWFDPYELCPMVLCPREPMLVEGPPPRVYQGFDPRLAWLATRPVLNFQFVAFVGLAPLERTTWDGPDDLVLFDGGRVTGPPAAPITGVTRGEAHLYARWFGKSLPGLSTWAAGRCALPPTGYSELWRRAGREWTSSSPVVDEEIGVVVSKEDVDLDPDAIDLGEDEWLTPDHHPSLFGPWERAGDVGFRTAVSMQIGLLTPSSYGDAAKVANVRLTSPLARSGGR